MNFETSARIIIGNYNAFTKRRQVADTRWVYTQNKRPHQKNKAKLIFKLEFVMKNECRMQVIKLSSHQNLSGMKTQLRSEFPEQIILDLESIFKINLRNSGDVSLLLIHRWLQLTYDYLLPVAVLNSWIVLVHKVILD